jgi:lysophospholipase L1-like esterase
MLRRVAAILTLVLSFTAGANSIAYADSPPKFNPPKSYYLSLGDSLGFGYQQAVFNAELPDGVPAAAFDHGYTDVFAAQLNAIRPGIEAVNLSCPGETARTMVAGGCPYSAAGFPLHVSYAGAQLDAAVAFLHAHRGQISPITLAIGNNDAIAVFRACAFNAACITAALPQLTADLQARLASILDTLRTAAPDAEIIVLRSYNPFAVIAPESNDAVGYISAKLADTVASHRARSADAFTPFNLAPPQPATLCALTAFCTPLRDIHPTDAGYAVIADAFFVASDYLRLTR